MFQILRIVLALLFLQPVIALAATIEVTTPDDLEVVSAELKEGGKATVTVYLESSGDLLGDIPILLLDNVSGGKVAQRVTKSDGIVSFEDIPAGKYKAVNALSKERKKRTTAQIGDIRIALQPLVK